jgi:hypothetical protein
MLVEDQLRAMPMVDLHALQEKVDFFRQNPPEATRPA